MSAVAKNMATTETSMILEMRVIHKRSKAPTSRPLLRLLPSTLDVRNPAAILYPFISPFLQFPKSNQTTQHPQLVRSRKAAIPTIVGAARTGLVHTVAALVVPRRVTGKRPVAPSMAKPRPAVQR